MFFYKVVCGMEVVDLEVRLRKTEKRIPVLKVLRGEVAERKVMLRTLFEED